VSPVGDGRSTEAAILERLDLQGLAGEGWILAVACRTRCGRPDTIKKLTRIVCGSLRTAAGDQPSPCGDLRLPPLSAELDPRRQRWPPKTWASTPPLHRPPHRRADARSGIPWCRAAGQAS